MVIRMVVTSFTRGIAYDPDALRWIKHDDCGERLGSAVRITTALLPVSTSTKNGGTQSSGQVGGEGGGPTAFGETLSTLTIPY